MKLRTARMVDLAWVAANMRRSDIEELKASSGSDPLDALLTSVDKSVEAYALEGSDGMCCAVLGVGPSTFDGCYIVWLLGTDAISKEPRQFVKITRFCVQAWLQKYGSIGNAVDARQTKTHKWLKLLGFSRVTTWEHFGVSGLPFHLFMCYAKDKKEE